MRRRSSVTEKRTGAETSTGRCWGSASHRGRHTSHAAANTHPYTRRNRSGQKGSSRPVKQGISPHESCQRTH